MNYFKSLKERLVDKDNLHFMVWFLLNIVIFSVILYRFPSVDFQAQLVSFSFFLGYLMGYGFTELYLDFLRFFWVITGITKLKKLTA